MNEEREEERKGDQECMTTTVINKQTHQTVETPQRGTTTDNPHRFSRRFSLSKQFSDLVNADSLSFLFFFF